MGPPKIHRHKVSGDWCIRTGASLAAAVRLSSDTSKGHLRFIRVHKGVSQGHHSSVPASQDKIYDSSRFISSQGSRFSEDLMSSGLPKVKGQKGT